MTVLVDEEVTGLGARMAMLEAARALAATVVGLAAWRAPDGVAVRAELLLAAAVAYVGVTTALELVRRRTHRRWPLDLGVALDALFLAVALGATGGTDSPLVLLAPFLLVAVTLLVSFRTGVKLALWTALLVSLVVWLQQAHAFAGPARLFTLGPTALVGMLLVFAGATAAFAASNENALRTGRAHFRALSRLAADLAVTHDEQAIAAALARSLTEDLHFRRAAVIVGEHGDGHAALWPPGTWRGVCHDGKGHVLCEGAWPEAADDLLGDLAGEAGARLWRLDSDRRSSVIDDILPGAVNTVVVPLAADDAVLGVAVAEWPATGARTTVPAALPATINEAARQAALALQTSRLLAEVERLAARDPLTGLANRRAFADAAEREVARARRHARPLGLVIIDIDHFKHVNDTHGHQVGDEVLRSVAAVLTEELRGEDLVARWGGEEFVVLVPDGDLDAAVALADRLRAAIRRGVGAVAITASAGVAVYPDHGLELETVLLAADRALYRAKRTGRNRSVPAPSRRSTVPDELPTPVEPAEYR